MAQQLRIRAQTPPAAPEVSAGLTLDYFDFDTNKVVLTALNVRRKRRTATIPFANAPSETIVLGEQAPRVSVKASVNVPQWVAAQIPSIVALTTNRSLLFPLNVFYDNGNLVRFTPNGWTDIPRWNYIIDDIDDGVVRNVEGGVWVAEYAIEFVGASIIPPAPPAPPPPPGG